MVKRVGQRGWRHVAKNAYGVAKHVAPYVNRAVKGYIAGRAYSAGSGTVTKTRAPTESGATYGDAFLYKTTYRKKRGSKRRMRFGRKKTNKFMYQLAKIQNPTQTVASASNYAINTTLAGAQRWFSMDFLKGNDVRSLMQTQIPAASTAAVIKDLRMYLSSFQLSYFLTNTGTGDALIEIYSVIPRFDIPESEIPTTIGPANDFATWFYARYGSLAVGDSNLPDAHGEPYYFGDTLGTSLFMFPMVNRKFKIMSIKRLKLGAGQTFSTVMKLGSSKSLDYADWETIHYKRGISSSLVFRIHGLAPNSIVGTDTVGAAQVRFGWYETQTSKVVNIKQTAQAALPGSVT